MRVQSLVFNQLFFYSNSFNKIQSGEIQHLLGLTNIIIAWIFSIQIFLPIMGGMKFLIGSNIMGKRTLPSLGFSKTEPMLNFDKINRIPESFCHSFFTMIIIISLKTGGKLGYIFCHGNHRSFGLINMLLVYEVEISWNCACGLFHQLWVNKHFPTMVHTFGSYYWRFILLNNYTSKFRPFLRLSFS